MSLQVGSQAAHESMRLKLKTNLKRTRVRNAMADALIDRSTHALREASIAKRRRISTGINNHLMNSPVNLIRCHTWLHHKQDH
jgi:hypothetical protein